MYINTADSIVRTCCFLGHREICETEELRAQLYHTIEKLIVDHRVDTFLFGSKSRFNSLCYELVTEIKEKYPCIKRIYVRAEFPVIGEDYRKYLLEHYEDTYYPASVLHAGRASYVKRNKELIEGSRFCVFYFDEAHLPGGRKSGTKIAYDFALNRKKTILRFPHFSTAAQAAIKG